MNTQKKEIYELQHMLRKIALTTGEIPLVNPSGVYDQSTIKTVEAFQKLNSIKPCKTVNTETWEKIFEKYKECMFKTSKGEPIYPYPSCDYEVKGYEKSDFIMIVQIVLSSLSIVYDDFDDVKITGIYDETTKNAVKRFQGYHGLEQNGIMDKITWDVAARSFNTHFANCHYAS